MRDSENKIEQAALGYAAKGWKVLPVRRTKVPYLNDWTGTATTDQDEIRGWWRNWPDANVGILTGSDSGIFVLDVDGEEGAASLGVLLAELDWEMPETLTATTGRGTHFYFKHPGGKVKCRTGLKPGIDIRGDGGYVVAPSSIHRSGRAYQFVSDDVAVAWADSSLIDLITAGEDRRQATGNDGEVISVGERNTKLFQRACGMRGSGMEETEINDRLSEINEKECADPLPDDEVQTIAQSASRYPKGSPAQKRENEANPLFYWPFNVDSWLANRDVLFMTDAQRGRYISLLAETWRGKGELPNDLHKLYKLSRATCSYDEFVKELPEVMGPFEGYGTDSLTIVHRAYQDLWEKQNKTYEQRKAAAKASVESRKRKIEVPAVAA